MQVPGHVSVNLKKQQPRCEDFSQIQTIITILEQTENGFITIFAEEEENLKGEMGVNWGNFAYGFLIKWVCNNVITN